MKLKFLKMQGAGNDFICLDGIQNRISLSKTKIAELCHRQKGVGADGVLVLLESKDRSANFRMRYYNADGGEAEMCGNGARCFAQFIKNARRWKKGAVSFQTKAGIISASFLAKDLVSIELTQPSIPLLNELVSFDDQTLTVHIINTGVPHAVVFVQDLENVPVFEWGRALRNHSAFAPHGTNVNFVQVLGSKVLAVRTYERGVEDETLACGTGIVASSLIAHVVHAMKSPIKVKARSGDELKVAFLKKGSEFHQVTLAGPTKIVFEGEIYV